MTTELEAIVNAHVKARWDALSQEEQAAQLSKEEKREQERIRTAAFWDECRQEASSDWGIRVCAANKVGLHNFFDGRGIPAYSMDPFKPDQWEMPYTPVFRALYSLYQQGYGIALYATALKIKGTMAFPILAYLDEALLPPIRKDPRVNRDSDSASLYYFSTPGHIADSLTGIQYVSGLVDTILWGDFEGVPSPLLAPFIEAMISDGEPFADGIPTCKAFGRGSPTYEDIQELAEPIYFPSADILLSEGVVVNWPPSGKRVRIRFEWNRLASDRGWQEMHPFGERLLHIEPSADPLTPTVPKGHLRIFGRGSSQQDDRIPTYKGEMPVCLIHWTADCDYTWNVLVNLDESGKPVVAWVDGSCT